jgi:hypothetical protein
MLASQRLVRHLYLMSAPSRPDKLSLATAEEVLRMIFGDDLKGCNVSLDSIAEVINQALLQRGQEEGDLIDMYEKLVEALDLLSTPPDGAAVGTPSELQSLLGERLDTIHTLTQRTKKTTDSLKALRKS